MRTTLWPGLLKALLHNQKRQQSRVRLFECGLTFVREGERLEQVSHLAGVVCGAALPEQWATPDRPQDFFDLKSDVEALLASTGEEGEFNFAPTKHPALHPGQSARVMRAGARVGWIGALHPAVVRQLDLEGDVFVFELNMRRIASARIPKFAELSKYPAIRRDIAVVTEEGISADRVRNCIRAHAGPLLRDICLFDVYRGKGVSEAHKSMAFSLILQDFSSTLTDSTVDDEISRIVSGLEQKLGATLRV
jgi:phenylalanyl-tRNA synthetase beta chain